MTRDAVRHIVDQSSCCIDGVTYVFSLQWVAVEKFSDAVLPRRLVHMAVRAVAPGADPVTMNLLVWATEPGDLHSLVVDALQDNLAERLRKNASRPIRSRAYDMDGDFRRVARRLS